MNSKRMLTLLVAICLMVSVIAPAAGAVQFGGGNTNTNVQQGESASTGNWFKDTVASLGEAFGLTTVKNDKSHIINKENLSFENGKWVATIADGVTIDLTDAQLPEDIQALREASEHYTNQDVVYAFVTLDADPAAELYSSINAVPAALTASMIEQHNALISAIEQNVLGGNELNVVSQFTYLTNSIVVATQFGNLEPIAALKGVKSVFLSPVYEVCEVSDTVYPATESSTIMTNVAQVWQEFGYTGAGMTIAILDTGLDLDHPSFAADPENPAWSSDWVQELLDTYDLNAETLFEEEDYGTLTAGDLYYSAKVPFHFNYALGNTSVGHADGLGDHGTHVAGIAAANKVEGSGVVGMAPDAQIIVMKVFDPETGGSNMFDLVLALEDCMTMGIDVVNMSLGSPAGFSDTDIEEIDSIFQRINESDMIVDVAAGNESTSSYASFYGYYLQTTENIDNSTMSSPATYANSMAIASVDNNLVPSDFFILADGTQIFYQHSVEYLYGEVPYSLDLLADDGVLDYVVIDGLGEAEEFYDAEGNSLVEGKIAVIPRGTLSFGQKTANAEAAGALAVMIWDNITEDIFTFGMTTVFDDGSYPSVPVILISLADGQKMADAEVKTLEVSAEYGYRVDVNGSQISSFSSWGVAPDLRLLPDLTGVGGNVYSCYDGGQYGIMSGTSMATPQVAGVTALLLQYLKEQFPDASDDEMRVLCDSILMSTAKTVIDKDTDLEASPRQQGAGLVDALAAITAEAYLTVEGSARPKAELGDDESGEFEFTFTVHNFGTEAKTYNLRASLLCEDYEYVEDFGEYFMAEQEHALDASAVTFSSDSVTVPAGESVDVTVSIALTEDDIAWINDFFPSGNYVEGFVYLEGEGEVTLSLPFLGFYGSWDAAPVFDTGYWYENSFWAELYEEIVVDGVEANMYYHVMWTDVDGSSWMLGLNPYSGAQIDEYGNVIYSSDNNVISPNGDGAQDAITDVYLSLMRNAEVLTFTYTDEEGNELWSLEMLKESKTMYISGYGGTVPFVYSWYYMDYPLYDFSDVEDGDVVYLNISAVIDYEGAETQYLDTIPLYIDNTAPVLDTENIVEYTEDGRNYITLTFEEEHPAFAALTNPSGTQIYSRFDDRDFVDNGDGTWSIDIDVTGRGDHFMVILSDYGCNEVYYDLYWSESGANNPEIDLDALYAYQVFNLETYYYEGYDYMFGWGTIDPDNAVFEMQSSDAYEYYALTAAEYAGGYVFATDAGHNFLYMIPGLWNRNFICNLGINVVDMAFDETTGTMYLVSKDQIDDYTAEYGLHTVDLLTGELTTLVSRYGYGYTLWAMTFVDDRLLGVKYNDSKLYEVNLGDPFEIEVDSGYGYTYNKTIYTYSLFEVKDENGEPIVLTDSNGDPVCPEYSQSMTYSEKDGKIYWAYYGADESACDLITIDPTDWSCEAVSFGNVQEYAGLFTIEGEYELPVSDAVTILALDQHELVLGSGEEAVLTASLLPWNAPVTEDIIWTSSDESVATVENGVVVAVGEGPVTITASYGETGIYDECQIVVVNIEGSFNAFNYYTYDGTSNNWFSYDMGEKTMENFVDYCGINFISADYNGHDGYIYGYCEAGQFYKYDPITNVATAIGQPVTNIPADMAYDYYNGYMYAIVYDYNAWTTTIYYVNMNTGALVEAATAYDIFISLACDTYGNLYGISYYGELHALYIMEDETGGGGGGIMPWFDDGFGVDPEGTTPSYYVYMEMLMELPVSEMNYAQSMCYDHNNNVLLWANPESSSIYWIGGLEEYNPFIVNIGDPSNGYGFNYFGMHVVPDEIPELPYFPVENIAVEDMMLLVNGVALPSLTITPLNATNQNVTYVSSDESVVAVENGMLVGVGVGSATITATLDDEGNVFVCEFNVSVKNSTGDIYSFLMTDIATYSQFAWIQYADTDPQNYTPLTYIMDEDYIYYLLYAAEYVDGYVYAYGYDMSDYSASWQFLTIDPNSWSVIDKKDMGSNFPFVYDLAFDYTTGAMYALAGPSDNVTDLYYVDIATGELVLCMLTEPMFMSIAVDEAGTLYAMATSEIVYDEWGSVLDAGNAMLYTVDVEAGTYEVFMDTGVKSNKLAPMTYSHETGYIYWNAFYQADYFSPYEVGFYLIDMNESGCYKLGNVGVAGSQLTGMVIIPENAPEIPDTLQNVLLSSDTCEINVGDSVQLEYMLHPYNLSSDAVEITWSSADESVATVDENGVVTGVAFGETVITMMVDDGNGVMEAECRVIVYGDEDYFISYNLDKMGFAKMSRLDPTQITMLTEGEEIAVAAMEMINGVIYAYDVNGDLFTTTEESNFVRNYIGNANAPLMGESDESYEYYLTIRDMAWDAANGRLLVLGCEMCYEVEDDYTHENWNRGCIVYTVDLATGQLTELVEVGATEYDDGDYRVVMLTVDDNGQAYILSYFMSYVSLLNLDTGVTTDLTTLQNQNVSASDYGDPMAMAYDSLTNAIYMAFTQNGNYYCVYKYDIATTAITLVGNMGEVEVGRWTSYGDSFAGLVINKHICQFELTNTVQPTCEEDGYHTYTCYCGNSYEDPIAAPGHNYQSVTTEPTCVDKGLIVYTCTACPDSYEVVLPSIGHDFSSVTTAPTCTEDGQTVYTCAVCKYVYVKELPASGHSYKTTVVEATCTTNGYTQHVCEVCNDSYVTDLVVAEDHKLVAKVISGNCTEGGKIAYTCSVCGYVSEEVELAPNGHAFVTETKEATCTDDGYERKTCSVCGIVEETVITAPGHVAGEAVKENEVAASCSTDGSYDAVVYCQTCNAELSRETTVVSATGEHVFATEIERVEVTCTTDGYVIMACGCGETQKTVTTAPGHIAAEAVKENEVIVSCGQDGSYDSVVYCQTCHAELSRENVVVAATGEHVYATEVERVDATCTEAGYVIMACGCGETQKTEIAAAGHTAGEAVKENEVAATCGKTGSYESVVTCVVCQAEISRETVEIPATGAHNVLVERVEATCTEAGYVLKTCSVCGYTEKTETAATGHVAGEWVTVKEATTEETGLKQQSCTVCGKVIAEETIPALDDPSYTSDNVYLFVIFAMLAMTGCAVLVFKKKYF